ncbi:MAG TPA: hypothetical protein VFV97_00310 [Rhodanobacteraceae bacterium]|nr:hypothetical protein [Rhodanobacteraceae bacterium]
MDTTGIPRKFPCTLTCRSNGPHIQQIYVGFGMLADAGIIGMRQHLERTELDDDNRPLHLRDVRAGHLEVDADGIRLAYDVHDSDEIDADLLKAADFYFKRSWNKAAVDTSATPERVLPLGANVWVNAEAPDWLGLRRSWLALNMVDLGKNVVRSLGMDRTFGDRLFTPRLADLEAEPPIGMPARVLFLAEAWNPATAPTPATADERVHINRMRAACMRALRDAFGENATCGFRPTEFAAREFGDLVSSEALTLKRNYLATLRQHSICVATSGLHRSIGWKFAEYLSMARAIVSERLHATLPGELAVARNYLEFDSPESCLAQVSRLFADTVAREDMMRRNREYYLANLRPDALVLNTLRTAHAMSAR